MLNAKKLGLAAGIIWGVCMFICTLISLWTGYSKEFLLIMTSVYPGYQISLFGSVIGSIWGFFDGFIFFFLLGWLYNKL